MRETAEERYLLPLDKDLCSTRLCCMYIAKLFRHTFIIKVFAKKIIPGCLSTENQCFSLKIFMGKSMN